MNQDMLFLQEVAIQADAFYEQGEQFGEWAAEALRNQRSQVTNLENIANTSLKVSDVLNYLKKQTAKARQNVGWRQKRRIDKNNNNSDSNKTLENELGGAMIEFISNDLKSRRDTVCNKVARNVVEITEERKQEIYLLLIREFIRQVVAQYELKGR